MANHNDSAEKFISEVAQLLETKDFTSAVNMFNDVQNETFLKNNSWDIIPVLCKHISKEKKLEDDDLSSCCERLLEKVANESNPDEALLEFLSQMDEADDEKFTVVLRLIKIILCRQTTQRRKSLEWTLNSIRSYMEVYSYGVNSVELNQDLEDFYSGDKLSEIESVTNSVLEFYEYFVAEAKTNPEEDELKQILSSRLLQMFDIFLPYVQLETYPNIKVLQCKIISTLLELISNPMVLLEFVFYRALNVMKPKVKESTSSSAVKGDLKEECLNSAMNTLDAIENCSPFEDEAVVSNLAYGMFFYSLLSEVENEKVKVPLVYNPKYIMLSLIYVTVPFFDQKTDTVIQSGLKFLDFLLNRLNYSLTKSDLYFSTHKSVLTHLNNIMVFSQVEDNRKLALTCFKKYIESFNWEARYLLLLNYRSHVHHSGTVGFLIGLLKEYTTFFLEQNQPTHTHRKFLKYYKGKCLFDLIKMYCYTSNVSNDDLVENADHVISSLNALRYLVLRDKKNFTGIKTFIKKIDKDFLKPLKGKITHSRNFYELKVKECENSESKSNIEASDSDLEVELKVKGQALPKLTKEQQKMAYQSCLNAVDLIDSLHGRLLECIQEVYPFSL